ncbi:MAG: hypothetical protein IBX48_05385 [Thiomicrospira sp.]|uniref:hypothetical protein n=1 Tax=Thiomicrospira sp. TaxID=935 RepID=UPI0019F8B962|nr:hypothetical protein [Thiomicrospira sp.]MBE0493756.1 hypothetical protein [Thiomicrospira sp.]
MTNNFSFKRLVSIMVTGQSDLKSAPDLSTIGSNLLEQLQQSLPYDVQTRLLSGYAAGIEQVSVQNAQAFNWEVQLFLTHKASHTPELDSLVESSSVTKIISLGQDTTSKRLIPDPAKQRDQMALNFADLLIIYWDSDFDPGQHNDHSQLIGQAAQSRKPVIWLSPDGQMHWLELERLDDATLELLKASDYSSESLVACFKPFKHLDQTPISRFIELLLNPTIQTHNPNATILRELTQTNGHTEFHDTGRLHDVMTGLLHSDKKDAWFELKRKFSAYRLPKLWSTTPDEVQPKPGLNEAFAHHDRLAEQAGGLHRSNIWLLYGFAALAVLVAVSAEVWQLHWLAYVELALIAMVIYRVWWARKIQLHQKWIRHRYLAEQMRYCIMGYPALAIPKAFLEPVWQINNQNQLQLTSAELWLLQRNLIVSGLPCDDGKIYTPPYHNHVLAEHIQAGVRHQMRYHQRHHHQKHLGHKRLHALAELQFLLTFIAVVMHIYIHANWLLLFTAALPAFAAGLHGILTKLEMERISGQSARLYQQLEHLDLALTRFIQQTPAGDDSWQHWLSLHYLANKSLQTMSDNITQWQHLIKVQQTEIPA